MIKKAFRRKELANEYCKTDPEDVVTKQGSLNCDLVDLILILGEPDIIKGFALKLSMSRAKY